MIDNLDLNAIQNKNALKLIQKLLKMIGSPPGHIGYEKEDQLTGKLRSKPYSIVLLDEIEKAHPRVFDIFLQVFGDGRLTDAKGRTVDAHNAIFILTSNIGSDKHAEVGFLESKESDNVALEGVRRIFRPELINRIDEQIVFRSLSESDNRKILKPILAEITQNLLDHYQAILLIDEEVEIFLARTGYSQKYGARELRRTVEQLLQTPLSQLILSGEIKKYKTWRVVCNGEGLLINPEDH